MIIAIVLIIVPAIIDANRPVHLEQEFRITQTTHIHSDMHDFQISGVLVKNPNQGGSVHVRIELFLTNPNGAAQQLHQYVTLTGSNTIQFIATDRTGLRVDHVTITAHGETWVIQGGVFEGIFSIPFLIIFIIFLILAIVATKNASYTQLTNRMHNIDTRMQANPHNVELERLQREKAQLQQQMDSFVECQYCKSRNPRNQRKCDGCGAQVR